MTDPNETQITALVEGQITDQARTHGTDSTTGSSFTMDGGWTAA